VKNNAERASGTGMNGAYSVAKIRSVVALRASNRPMMNRKDHRIALVRREHFNAGLLARPLFGKHKFAACKIAPSLTQEEGDLKWKDDLAVQILVQTIEITRAVLQEQGRRALLAGAVALLRKVRKLFGIVWLLFPKPIDPFVRERHKMRINERPELLYDPGQRIIEVFILALAEGITGHLDPTAKLTVVGIIGGYFFTNFPGENTGQDRKSMFIEMRPRFLPVDFLVAKRLREIHLKSLLARHPFYGSCFES